MAASVWATTFLYDNIGVLSRPPQIGSTIDCPKDCTQNAFLVNGGIPPQSLSGITVLDQATARDATSAYLPDNVKYPYSESWNFGVQKAFRSNYTAEVRYVGTRGVDLNVQNRINIQPVVTPNNYLPTFITCNSTCQNLQSSPGSPGQVTLGALNDELNAGGFYVPAYINLNPPLDNFIVGTCLGEHPRITACRGNCNIVWRTGSFSRLLTPIAI